MLQSFPEYFTWFNTKISSFSLILPLARITTAAVGSPGMNNKTNNPKPRLSLEWLLGGSLSRIGDIIDSYTRRKEVPRSSLATSQLIERLKRLLDSKVREIPGKGKVVPHNISLRIQWDKFATDENDAIDRLQQELLTATVDHINDSHFYTLQPIDLKVTPDYFTEGVKLLVSFDKFGENPDSDELNITILPGQMPDGPNEYAVPTTKTVPTLLACVDPASRRQTIRIKDLSGGRATVGRDASNHLAIDDPSVSKYHGSISVGPDAQIKVADTGSTNGTFINGQRIAYGEGTLVKETDVVKFGSVEVTFKIEQDETLKEAVPDPLSLDSDSTEVSAEAPENSQQVNKEGKIDV